MTFEGGMGKFQKKISCRLISREKYLARKYLPYNGVVCNSITRGLGKKKILTQTKSPIPLPPPSKVKWSAPYELP